MMMLMLIGLVVSAVLPVLDRWTKRYFITLFSILLLMLISLVFDLIVYLDPDLMVAEKTAVFFEFLFISLLVFMPTIYLLHRSEKNWRYSTLFYTEFSLLIVFFVLLVITQFSTFIYYQTPDNMFIRGPWFPLLLIPLIAMIVINIAAIIRSRKILSRKMYISLLIYLVPFLIAMIVHLFIDVILPLVLIILIFASAMFFIIILEQIDHYRLQQKEIARQQANILILQMRPHFICNSLTSIYYLCEQDPKKAQRVINDFTIYLRKNFTAISSSDTIPFSEELAHTKAYLSVENALHEDLLSIDYDTPHTLFRIPPLTLQPVVENAIKHGLDPDADPLHISIRTLKTDLGNEIIVTDNGIGFEPADDNTAHFALNNIQQRLEIMCGGTMMITSGEEGGTIVKMIIPTQETA